MQIRSRTLFVAIIALTAVWALAVLLQLWLASSPESALMPLTFGVSLAAPVLTAALVLAVVLAQRRSASESATRMSNLEKQAERGRAEIAAVLPRLDASDGEMLQQGDKVAAAAEQLADISARLSATATTVERVRAAVGEAERRLRDVDILSGRASRLQESVVELRAELGALGELQPRTLDSERKLRQVETSVAELRVQEPPAVPFDLVESIVAIGRKQGLSLTEIVSEREALSQVRSAVSRGRSMDALPYLRAFPSIARALSLSEARSMFKYVRRVGYLSDAVLLIREIAERFGKPEDARAATLLESELALYRGELTGENCLPLPPLEGELQAGTVMHIVGKALPQTQSGYTLRTQYTVEAQRRVGLTPVVVAQSGASDRLHAVTETYLHRGINYYLLGGPQRGVTPWGEWLEANIVALAEVVRIVRPAALHVHSDFLNSLIALPVARAYGIPIVNETRGFWEESWLSRTATAEGWTDLAAVSDAYGSPDMYRLRAEREAVARSESDAVVTLARVMREHISAVGQRLGVHVPSISIAPNAVEPGDFPISLPDAALRAELGIGAGDVVVGYVSSIVEYEGIDTLVRAMFELEMAIEAARSQRRSDDEPVVLGQETQGGGDTSRIFDGKADDSQTWPEPEGAPNGVPLEMPDGLAPLRRAIADGSRVFGAPVLEFEISGGDPVDAEVAQGEAVEKLVDRIRAVHPAEDEEVLRGRARALLAAGRSLADVNVRLLVVGDGAELNNLRQLASDLALQGVIFTGRVPHERVLDFYALIDLFVVPRKRADVTDLVTPLKPFEALSSGRPCVFSDVRALAEIAEDSGAVELFRAGDHHDLALRVASLLSSPARLAEMSRAGAEWVRNERTWDFNALVYLDVYRTLGLEIEAPAYATELLRLRDDGIGARTIIQRLASGPSPAPTGWFLLEAKSYTAEQVMTDGWRIAKHPAIHFAADLDWEAAGRANRSWGFHLHAWEFIDPVLLQYDKTRDERLLRWMLDVAVQWWSQVADKPVDETMAWYDMALSLRMPRLARLLIAVAKSTFSDEAALLLRAAIRHIEHSLRAEAFNVRNNHGFFAAVGALDFSRWLAPLPDADQLHQVGAQRLHQMLTRQFAPDGGHLEHSPDYHRMLLGSFEQALAEDLIDDLETKRRVERAARVLGWLVQPNGRLVQFGDSAEFDVQANALESSDPRTQFIISDGREGVPEDDELLVLPDAGYAIVRSPQPTVVGERQKSSYLALQAGFHSRAHKHADDLTFTWFDRGHEILVDAGRFGYIDLLPPDSADRLRGFYYSAPERQYVESTLAHNTVEVDGNDIERRKREPYGSALGDCSKKGERFVLCAEVQHAGYSHARSLTLEPHVSLHVADTIDPHGDAVDAVAWFNMPGEFELDVSGGTIAARMPDGPRLVISGDGELVEPVRGQRAPLRGWRSLVDRELVPTWSFGFRASVATSTVLNTSFTFDEG